MTDRPADFTPHVHLPAGYLPAGRKVRAVCSCGQTTTPRVNEDRALAALLAEHGWTPPICALCGTDHQGYPGRDWDSLRLHDVEILVDPATGGTFLVCRGMPRSCRDGAAQKQLHLDRAVADGFGFELPRPRLRVVDRAAEPDEQA
ncbi:hypothetical protein [Nocardia carnea]|uniref:hypothetical protein n=1 Tax=Nocardia carnea TaxID=37328 RepID=UPI0002D6491B|nr:hypothetical protein [Nocardia carnea]